MSEPIVLERYVAASPSTIYAYLTESEKWARWQGVGATLEARAGGLLSLAMPNGANARGEFLELVPDRRVVFTWGWRDHPSVPPGSSVVEIELVAQGSGTLLRLTHRGLPEDERQVHSEGWNRYLPRLASVALGEAVGPDLG